MKTRIIALTAIIAVSLTMGSCKKWLDVNDNPNLASKPDINLVLPSAQMAVLNTMGNAFQINGSFWAQHWTQSPLANQYKQYDQYQVSSNNYDRPWSNLYAGALVDLNYVYNKAKADKQTQYQAVARLMQAYTFHVLTDAFGDIPFSEALKGSPADGSVISPKYDSQESVYEGIITMIDEAIALIDPANGAHPGADDLIFGGDMSHWAEFANTLKLKAALRLSEKSPVRGKAIATAITGDFLTKSAKANFTSVGGNENPLYNEMVGLSSTTNIYASATSVNFMNAASDPRVYVFYTPLANGAVVGNLQGNFASSTAANGKSIGGYYVGANPLEAKSALAPVYLISLAESEFLQAEAIARTWLTGDDKGHYEDGIRASMADYSGAINELIADEYIDTTGYGDFSGLREDLIATSYAYPSSEAAKIQAIIEQKWVAMCGNQGFESWTEWRRTGYPVLTPSVASLAGPGVLPNRFIYPTTEVNLNTKFPGQKSIGDKVWWDAN
jgi:hypothetical protein